MVLRSSNLRDKLDFDACAMRYLGNAGGTAGVRAKRIEQWTFNERDETSMKKVKQTIVERA